MESPIPLSDFEVRLKELQAAVAKLESGELTLEKAFEEWEAGCACYGDCRDILSAAKARVEVLASNFRDETPEWELFGGVESQAQNGTGSGVDGDASETTS